MLKTCLTQYIKSAFFFISNNLLLNFDFGLNHCKCTSHTSNKVDKISPDIIPTRIDFENIKINYPHYSRSSLFEPLIYVKIICLKEFEIKDKEILIIHELESSLD